MTGTDLVRAFAKRVAGMVHGALGKVPMMWRPGIGDLLTPAETPATTTDRNPVSGFVEPKSVYEPFVL